MQLLTTMLKSNSMGIVLSNQAQLGMRIAEEEKLVLPGNSLLFVSFFASEPRGTVPSDLGAAGAYSCTKDRILLIKKLNIPDDLVVSVLMVITRSSHDFKTPASSHDRLSLDG